MTIEGLDGRLIQMRKAYPTQVICAFHYPDGLEVVVPMSPELIEADPSFIGPELMRLVQDSAAEARETRAGEG